MRNNGLDAGRTGPNRPLGTAWGGVALCGGRKGARVTAMSFRDLRSFLADLEAIGQLKRVRAEVDPRFEVAEIAQRVVREEGPALLFERVKGSRFPIAINFFGSFARIERAIGMHPEALGARLVRFAEELNPPSLGRLAAASDFLPRLLAFRPARAARGASQAVVEGKPDLDSLPIITCWPQDGGRFITFPLVFTRHPRTGKSNVGIYRMQVFDGTSTGMHWQIHKGGGFHYREAEMAGHALPVSVALGADPALMLAGIFPLPEALEEIAFAGILAARRTRLARARSIDLDVLADAEFVLEGEVRPHERHPEGPFGDHFGHYCDVADFPVFRVKTITRRANPIYPAAVVGKPPQEDRYMGDASQMILGPLHSTDSSRSARRVGLLRSRLPQLAGRLGRSALHARAHSHRDGVARRRTARVEQGAGARRPQRRRAALPQRPARDSRPLRPAREFPPHLARTARHARFHQLQDASGQSHDPRRDGESRAVFGRVARRARRGGAARARRTACARPARDGPARQGVARVGGHDAGGAGRPRRARHRASRAGAAGQGARRRRT